jgi:hypothetical protein
MMTRKFDAIFEVNKPSGNRTRETSKFVEEGPEILGDFLELMTTTQVHDWTVTLDALTRTSSWELFSKGRSILSEGMRSQDSC